MASELSNQLLASARERYDRTAKWSALAIVLVALFHLVVFQRYVELHEDSTAASAELAGFNERHQGMTELGTTLTALDQKISGWFDERLANHLARIKTDFVGLSAALADVREDRPGSYVVEGDAGDDPSDPRLRDDLIQGLPPNVAQVPITEPGRFDPGFRGDLVQGLPPNVAQLPPDAGFMPPDPAQMPFHVAQAPLGHDSNLPFEFRESRRVWQLPPPLVEALKKRDRGDLVELLRPVVDRQIVEPHFGRMNAEWDHAVSAELALLAAEAERRIGDLMKSDPERAQSWSQMLASVRLTSERLRQVRFAPPQDETWWYTTTGKDQRFGELRKEVDAPIRAALEGTADLQAIRSTVEQAIKAREADLVAIQDEQKRLAENFKKQSEVLAGLGEPFKFLAADIGYLITRFPMLIGALLAATAVMSARSLTKLLDAARAAEGPQGPKSAVEALSIRGTESTGPVVRRAILGVAWIGLAAWTLRDWPGEEAKAMPLFVAIGVAAVVIGEGYRAWLLRRALRAKT